MALAHSRVQLRERKLDPRLQDVQGLYRDAGPHVHDVAPFLADDCREQCPGKPIL